MASKCTDTPKTMYISTYMAAYQYFMGNVYNNLAFSFPIYGNAVLTETDQNNKYILKIASIRPTFGSITLICITLSDLELSFL